MNILIQRKVFNASKVRNCIGELFIDGVFFCYTLEDEVRANNKKIWGKTAIPAGDYSVKIVYSPKFKKELPLIYNDPVTMKVKKGDIEWSGVLFHGGNTEEDSAGCVLIGLNTDRVKIWNNVTDSFVVKLKSADKISLKIENRVFSSGLNKQIEIY